MNFTAEEISEFKTEAEDLLTIAEDSLLKHEKGDSFKPTYDSVFRVFHSLKGGAGMLGLEALQAHMHKIEHRLSELKAKTSFSKSEISFFLKSIDSARKIIAGRTVDFDYTIPAQPESPAHQPQARAKNPTLEATDYLIYLVDDDPDVIEIMAEVLSNVGLQTKSFTEPENLLAELKKRTPDLIVSDMKMPTMTGLDVAKAVRAIDPELPIIFVSGHLSIEILLESINSGIFASVEKPFRNETLITYCVAAARQYRLSKALSRTMNLLLYQFSDLDDFLKAQGKDEIRRTIQYEIDSLMKIRRTLKQQSHE